MKAKLLALIGFGFVLPACGQQSKKEMTMDFVDNVKVALADSGHIDLNSL